jgi:hypothetical protein
MQEYPRQYSEAKELFDKGELEAALALFVKVAEDPRWLDRCEIYISRIVSRLQQDLKPRSDEFKELEVLRADIRGRLASASLRRSDSGPPPPYLAPRPPARAGGMVGMGRPSRAPSPQPPLIVERTPHIDVLADGALEPGSEFKIRVYLDKLPARPGEVGKNVVGPEGTRIEMTLMPSSHFLVVGADTASFVMESVRGEISLPPFDLVVRPEEKWQGDVAGIIAVFFIDGRPCGKVSRQLKLRGDSTAPAPSPSRMVVVPNGTRPADLTVTIVADVINNGRQFQCTVTTPHLAEYREAKAEAWNLNDTTGAVVRGFMNRFTSSKTGADQLVAELTGAGKMLFNASPKLFQRAFWAMKDAGTPLRTIAVVSEEPYFPWELMVPIRKSVAGLEELEHPLGVLFGVGRWTSPDVISATRTITLTDSFVIAPNYGGRGDLKSAAAEADMVASYFNGELISPATFARIKTRFLGQPKSLIHFVCHGNSGDVETQSLRLEGDESLTSSSLIGITGLSKVLATKHPMVFLNACEVGRGVPSLVGLGGFAPTFIELGASAVIAPLWSVDDEIAHEIAETFYGMIRQDPTMPFSRVFSEIRAKAYVSGKDTYAAYCFFGDPLASLAG